MSPDLPIPDMITLPEEFNMLYTRSSKDELIVWISLKILSDSIFNTFLACSIIMIDRCLFYILKKVEHFIFIHDSIYFSYKNIIL